MDEILIHLGVNPIRIQVDKDYVPHQTFSKPQDDMYWDIPLSLNDQFFQVFKEFDLTLPDS